MEILLKKLVWPALAAEANFRNNCLLGTFRTCVETSGALEWGNLGLKSVRCELKNGKFVLLKYTVSAKDPINKSYTINSTAVCA